MVKLLAHEILFLLLIVAAVEVKAMEAVPSTLNHRKLLDYVECEDFPCGVEYCPDFLDCDCILSKGCVPYVRFPFKCGQYSCENNFDCPTSTCICKDNKCTGNGSNPEL